MTSLSFTVRGVPAPKAGMRPIPIKRGGQIVGSRMTASSNKGAEWAALVQHEALLARQRVKAGGIIWAGVEPLCLIVTFYLPRPVSLPLRVGYPVKRPDLDKLVRCLKDAMSGVLYRDDSQVVQVTASKLYAVEDGPRAEVSVSLMEEERT